MLDKANAGLPEHLFKRFRAEVEALRKTYPNSIVKHIMDVKGCSKKKKLTEPKTPSICAMRKKPALTPLKAIQMEGLLSRGLFSEIIDYVFNNYEWSERLDEVDRIT